MVGRDTTSELKKLLIKENIKPPIINKILNFYINSIKDESFQKQHIKISEENYIIYIQNIIEMFRGQEFTNELAQNYIRFVFEKIYRGSAKNDENRT